MKCCIRWMVGLLAGISLSTAAFAQSSAQENPALARMQYKVADLAGRADLGADDAHPLVQDAFALAIETSPAAPVYRNAPILQGQSAALFSVPDAWRGQELRFDNGVLFSLLWFRENQGQASWVRNGRSLLLPRSGAGRLYLVVQNTGADDVTLHATLAAPAAPATVVTEFAVSPAGPFAAISWIALERPDVKAWVLEKREGAGLWQRVLPAPVPARGRGEMRYAYVDTTPPAAGDYRLVAVESSGFLVPLAPVPLPAR